MKLTVASQGFSAKILAFSFEQGFSGAAMIPPPRQLAAARILAGLTQAELAKRAGVAESALYRYEAGKSDPRVNTIAAVVRALSELGVEFLDETDQYEIGVAIRKRRPQT